MINNFNTMIEYNDYLISKMLKITLNDYFLKVHSVLYSNIDISFMDYFLELCNKKK